MVELAYILEQLFIGSILLVQYQQVTISRVHDRRHTPHLLLWQVDRQRCLLLTAEIGGQLNPDNIVEALLQEDI